MSLTVALKTPPPPLTRCEASKKPIFQPRTVRPADDPSLGGNVGHVAGPRFAIAPTAAVNIADEHRPSHSRRSA